MRNVVTAAVVLAVSGVASANILVNGGFEDGESPWNIQTDNNLVPYGRVTNFARTGQASFLIGQGGGYVSANQLGEFKAGQWYELRLWVYNNGVGDDQLFSFVTVPNTTIIFNEDPVTTPLESWGEIVAQFTPLVDATSFGFRGRDDISSIYVDDISLTLIPEPTTVVGLGAVAFFARRRRG